MEVADTLKFLARSKVVEPNRKYVSKLKTQSANLTRRTLKLSEPLNLVLVFLRNSHRRPVQRSIGCVYSGERV